MRLLGRTGLMVSPLMLAEVDRIVPSGRVVVPYYLHDSFADFRPHSHHW